MYGNKYVIVQCIVHTSIEFISIKCILDSTLVWRIELIFFPGKKFVLSGGGGLALIP